MGKSESSASFFHGGEELNTASYRLRLLLRTIFTQYSSQIQIPLRSVWRSSDGKTFVLKRCQTQEQTFIVCVFQTGLSSLCGTMNTAVYELTSTV